MKDRKKFKPVANPSVYIQLIKRQIEEIDPLIRECKAENREKKHGLILFQLSYDGEAIKGCYIPERYCFPIRNAIKQMQIDKDSK